MYWILRFLWSLACCGVFSGDDVAKFVSARRNAFENVTIGFTSKFSQARLSVVEEKVLRSRLTEMGYSFSDLNFNVDEVSQSAYRRCGDAIKIVKKFELSSASHHSEIFAEKRSRCDKLVISSDERKGASAHISSRKDLGSPSLVIENVSIVRCFGEDSLFTSVDLDGCEFESVEGLVDMRFRLKGFVHVWTLNPSIGYACQRYRVFSDDFLLFDVQCSDFKEDNGWYWPHEITSLRFTKARQDALLSTEVTTLNLVKFSDPENTSDSLLITYPERTLVIDDRTGCAKRLIKTSILTDEELGSWCKEVPKSNMKTAFLMGSLALLLVICGIVFWRKRTAV